MPILPLLKSLIFSQFSTFFWTFWNVFLTRTYCVYSWSVTYYQLRCCCFSGFARPRQKIHSWVFSKIIMWPSWKYWVTIGRQISDDSWLNLELQLQKVWNFIFRPGDWSLLLLFTPMLFFLSCFVSWSRNKSRQVITTFFNSKEGDEDYLLNPLRFWSCSIHFLLKFLRLR